MMASAKPNAPALGDCFGEEFLGEFHIAFRSGHFVLFFFDLTGFPRNLEKLRDKHRFELFGGIA